MTFMPSPRAFMPVAPINNAMFETQVKELENKATVIQSWHSAESGGYDYCESYAYDSVDNVIDYEKVPAEYVDATETTDAYYKAVFTKFWFKGTLKNYHTR